MTCDGDGVDDDIDGYGNGHCDCHIDGDCECRVDGDDVADM